MRRHVGWRAAPAAGPRQSTELSDGKVKKLTKGNDVWKGNAGDNTVMGLGGNDTLDGRTAMTG